MKNAGIALALLLSGYTNAGIDVVVYKIMQLMQLLSFGALRSIIILSIYSNFSRSIISFNEDGAVEVVGIRILLAHKLFAGC